MKKNVYIKRNCNDDAIRVWAKVVSINYTGYTGSCKIRCAKKVTSCSQKSNQELMEDRSGNTCNPFQVRNL